ncbi:MAG: alpha/beta hydrolase [Actinomycetota bacterium]|nr:alpha/beta hydrolase [Actinomycetota bacterium]
MEITEHTGQVAGVEVFWRRSEPDAGTAPTLYVHGVPTHSDDWLPFLSQAGGVALDLPGFGRSGKPNDFDYSIAGYDRFLETFLATAGIDRFSLVVHGWGAVGLATAQRLHDRLERLVVLASVPLLPGYEWHRIARLWRRPVVGELFMGFTTRFGFKQLSKEANTTPGPLPDAMLDYVWKHFDHGTQRAILKLYRASAPEVLAAAGGNLGRITSPALVLWPTADPYLGAEFGPAYAAALGAAELEVVEDAGHWPWLDRPELVARVAAFLSG